MKSAAILSLLLGILLALPASAAQFAVATIPTPVLNTPGFREIFGGKEGSTLRMDTCGQIRALEFVALPGTVFRIEQELMSGTDRLYRVTTNDYPYPSGSGYFVDSRFVSTRSSHPEERSRHLPPGHEILRRLRKAEGIRYVWGGNVTAGIAALLEIYPANTTLSGDDGSLWQLAGLDCSGLLYEATDGVTPRNTSSLVSYGAAVPVAGRDAGTIARQLRPLDLIVWQGHVLIVIDRQEVIESRLECTKKQRGGVIVTPLKKRLEEIMQRRRPVDAIGEQDGSGQQVFVVRRWYGQATGAEK
ncbi:MAG: peptidoglycan endopeptidase [Geobacter sp.]|nr:peptidoglycan endopeptidase [Geobacter sp.]